MTLLRANQTAGGTLVSSWFASPTGKNIMNQRATLCSRNGTRARPPGKWSVGVSICTVCMLFMLYVCTM